MTRPTKHKGRDATALATVGDIGHRGDGLVELNDRRYHVPYAAPGDRVRLKIRGTDAEISEIIQPGQDRVMPPCAHFGDCGGCALQHLSDDFVANWKQKQVRAALAQRGFSRVNVRPTVTVSTASRRRAAFTAQLIDDKVQVGFQARRSKRLVPVRECPVLDPTIARALPGLAELAGTMLSRQRKGQPELRIVINQTATGLDIALAGTHDPDLAHRSALAAKAQALDLARLSVNGETLVTLRQPVVRFGGVSVVPPPAAFLQASREGEAALVALVLRALGPARHVADLFAGCGTFTFPAARRAHVLAVEGDTSMAAALNQAYRNATGIRSVEVVARDLFQRPLGVSELAPSDAVILDPPKAGGAAQATEIGASTVMRVAAVSCEPATFARDARILVDGGLELKWVVPVDQFRWSARIELVALFQRAD